MTTATNAFQWKNAQKIIDAWTLKINDADLNWSWIVTSRVLNAYATCAVSGTLDEARAWAWEQYLEAWADGPAYPGIYGLVDEMRSRTPSAHVHEIAAVMARARAEGRPHTRSTTRPVPSSPPPAQLAHLRLVAVDGARVRG
jgi:hypothetical protein